KTEQSDLNLAIYGGSGDSPRPVIAPADVIECYTLTRRAFEVAEAFQTPVIVLLDFFLSNRFEDLPENIFTQFKANVFPRVTASPSESPFQRFAVTATGVSPAAFPGTPALQHAITGLEHSERGFPNYDGRNHRIMTEKRLRKLDTLRAAWPAPEEVGPTDSLDIGIVAWGSTIGAVREALLDPRIARVAAGGYFPRLMHPLQEEPLRAFSARCRTLVSVELNATGQFTQIVERTVHRPVARWCDVPAEPLSVEQLVSFLEGELA
ncbi:2-oxoacid:acceptor oxidoreductase subunit alpha, partial [bacterium]|nr:2-oxoacid:acceptor oxidoreductase subunit alpha [candidate division CSSED10-310 bacterium]